MTVNNSTHNIQKDKIWQSKLFLNYLFDYRTYLNKQFKTFVYLIGFLISDIFGILGNHYLSISEYMHLQVIL